MPQSAYIHIPFCKSKCKYCSFISSANIQNKKGYLYSLLKEIDYYYTGENLKTFYLGGGTPSLLNIDEIEKIFSKFKIEPDAEITIEINPNDADINYLKNLRDMGFNRLSMGAQSFDDNLLKLIGRRHNSGEIFKAAEYARDAGFNNISLDLIYGLPEQTLEGFVNDLKTLVNMDIEHMSLYGLKIEEGCYFYNNMPANIPDDDLQAEMYLAAGEISCEHGFEHYEISNYAKPGYCSRHNTNYWRCGEYYGFGLAAHGYANGVRYSNTEELQKYMNSPVSREYGKFLTVQEMLEEKIFLGLRLAEGIDITELNREFDIDFNKKYGKVISKYLESGHLIRTKKGYRLSDNRDNNGFLISDIIMADFMQD